MKIKAIEQILKSSRIIHIYDDGDSRQWISDGAAYYPVDGIDLNAENICTIFDIQEKDRNKYSIGKFSTPDFISTADSIEDEELIDYGTAVNIVHDGEIFTMFDLFGAAGFIPVRWLKPYKDHDISFYARINEKGGRYIAVKEGMFLIGIFAPLNILNETTMNKIEKLYYKCKRTYTADK